jgi:hypothetical protein
LGEENQTVDDACLAIGQMVSARHVDLWNDQEMNRGLGRNVSKG